MTKAERERLVRCIQYLNLAEMRAFCQRHDLALFIHVERSDGSLRRTGDRDRKDIVLARILEFALRKKRTGPTVYPSGVVSNKLLADRLTSRTRLYYAQYDKKNADFIQTMKDLTDGSFATGMIARLVLRDFWTAGKAPTLRQFADEWVRATRAHTQPRPEGAYLMDLYRGEAGPGWKKIRNRRAREALRMLAVLVGD